ncbi:MAG: M16 family metallopeptidase, partial [Pyrinomonadaceae bacterium]
MASIQTHPPEPLAPIPFNIAEPIRETLPNGLRVVIVQEDRVPLVSYRLAFFRGDAHDPKGAIGLTSATAAMLTEGTANYSSRELAEKVERLGAGISTNASDDFTTIAASTLSIYAEEILNLMAEILFRPTFPESELDLYKRNALENLKYQRSQPNFLASEQSARLVYGHHPYSVVSPKAADYERLDREALAKFHESAYLPNNAVLIVVGDVQYSQLMEQINELFGDWPSEEFELRPSETIPERESRTLTIVDRPGSAQANIVLSNIAIPRNHPDHFAATVMNQILGAGASSRVFMNLREEKGYTYGAYTRIDAKKQAGDFEATAEVRTGVTGDSLKEFFYELGRIRDEEVQADELADAKSFLTGVFPIRAETQDG